MGKHQDDIEARFPTHVVTVTTDNSVLNCEVKTAGDVVVANAQALTEDEAVCAAREILGVKAYEPLKGAANDAEELGKLDDLLDRQKVHEYDDVDGSFTLDLANGNGSAQQINLTGSIAAEDTITVQISGTRPTRVAVVQEGAGAFDIDPAAWSANVDWGDKGAPTFGEATGAKRFLVFVPWNGVAYVFYDTTVFGL